MGKMIIGQTVCHLLITLVVYFGWFSLLDIQQPSNNGADEADIRRNTFVFNTFVWLQIFNMVNNRRVDNQLDIFEGIMHNFYFFLATFLMAGGQVLVMFTGGKAFRIVPLTSREWGISITLGLLSVVCGLVIRLVPDVLVDRLIPEYVKRRAAQLSRVFVPEGLDERMYGV